MNENKIFTEKETPKKKHTKRRKEAAQVRAKVEVEVKFIGIGVYR